MTAHAAPRCPTYCGRSVLAGRLMCPTCWARVPALWRAEVWRRWQTWRANLGDHRRRHEYLHAAEQAVHSVT